MVFLLLPVAIERGGLAAGAPVTGHKGKKIFWCGAFGWFFASSGLSYGEIILGAGLPGTVPVRRGVFSLWVLPCVVWVRWRGIVLSVTLFSVIEPSLCRCFPLIEV